MDSPLDTDILNQPVTAHMREDVARLHLGQSVGEALRELREGPPGGRIIYLYVVDHDGKLRGVVPARRLLFGSLEEPVESVMVQRVISVPHTATVLEACEFFTLHRLLAFPIVDDEGRLLGAVDVDLYTQEIHDLEKREGNEDLFQLIGVHLEKGREGGPLESFARRAPWLSVNVAGGLVAAMVMGIFEEELKKAVALALFVPVVLALAESVSIQSVSLALQALHGKRPTWRSLVAQLGRESLIGLLLGVASGGVVALAGWLWLGDWRVGLCLLGGLAGGVTVAAAIGLSAPYVFRILQRDPQVASGPLALACTDLATLFAYFGMARWTLS
jgi:magnesium transporter